LRPYFPGQACQEPQVPFQTVAAPAAVVGLEKDGDVPRQTGMTGQSAPGNGPFREGAMGVAAVVVVQVDAMDPLPQGSDQPVDAACFGSRQV